MLRISPPRPGRVLIRSAVSPVRSLSNANTLRTLPDISLPTVMPPWPLPDRIRRITTFSLGLATRRPSSLSPDLTATTSSLVLKNESSMRTLRDESGSQPSPFCGVTVWLTPPASVNVSVPPSGKLTTLTWRTTTFSEYTGWSIQNGPNCTVTPSISTLRQVLNSTNIGRSSPVMPGGMLDGTGTADGWSSGGSVVASSAATTRDSTGTSPASDRTYFL